MAEECRFSQYQKQGTENVQTAIKVCSQCTLKLHNILPLVFESQKYSGVQGAIRQILGEEQDGELLGYIKDNYIAIL